MSELDKLNKRRLALVGQLEAVLADLHDKGVEIGRLAGTPKSDPRFSSSRLAGLERETGKMRETRDDLQAQLDDINLQIQLESAPKPTPEQQAALNEQSFRDTRREQLAGELAQVQAVMAARRLEMGPAVVRGGDPGKLANQVHDLELTAAGLQAGLDALR